MAKLSTLLGSNSASAEDIMAKLGFSGSGAEPKGSEPMTEYIPTRDYRNAEKAFRDFARDRYGR